MQLGVSSFAFGWAVSQGSFDENSLLNCALEADLSLVQFGDHIRLVDFSETRLQSLKRRAESEQIVLEIGGRMLTPENLAAHIETARALDARLLRFVVDGAEFEPSPAQIIEILRAALPALQNTSLILGLENHDRLSARALRGIVDALDSPHVGICLDTANSLGAGEGLETVLRELASVTVNLHIKDISIRRVPYLMGFEVEGAIAGRGLLDIPALWAQMSTFSRCQTAVLETWVPPESEMSATLAKEAHWAHESVAFLRSLTEAQLD